MRLLTLEDCIEPQELHLDPTENMVSPSTTDETTTSSNVPVPEVTHSSEEREEYDVAGDQSQLGSKFEESCEGAWCFSLLHDCGHYATSAGQC